MKKLQKFIQICTPPNHAYSYRPNAGENEPDLSYAKIGIILGHFKPEILKNIATLALKLFRSRPIPTEKFDEIFQGANFKVDKIDKQLQVKLDKLQELAKSKPESGLKGKALKNAKEKINNAKQFLTSLNNYTSNPKMMFGIIVGALAAEAGRGTTGLENFVATLHVIKHWDDKQLLNMYGIPKDVQNKSLSEAISEDLMPDVYTGKLETRIAVGHKGSQAQIKYASGETADKKDNKKGIANQDYNTMKNRDNSYLKNIETKREYKKSKWEKFSDSNLERKFNRHAISLYGASLNTIVQDIKDYIKEGYYKESAALVRDWHDKNYLSYLSFSDVKDLFFTILNDEGAIKNDKNSMEQILNDLFEHTFKTEPQSAEIFIDFAKQNGIELKIKNKDDSMSDADEKETTDKKKDDFGLSH